MGKVVDRNSPKELTSKQRRFVDQLIERFGEGHTNVKRSDLKKAGKDLLGTSASPAWITRNLKVRNKEKRGRYDLSALLKLPVRDAEPKPVKVPKAQKEPKAPKTPKAPKVPKEPKAPKVPKTPKPPAEPKQKRPAKKKAPAPPAVEVPPVEDDVDLTLDDVLLPEEGDTGLAPQDLEYDDALGES